MSLSSTHTTPRHSTRGSQCKRLSIRILILILIILSIHEVFLLSKTTTTLISHPHQSPPPKKTAPTSSSSPSQRPRVLYVICTSKEYDDGSRGTKKGFDRLFGKVLPSVVESMNALNTVEGPGVGDIEFGGDVPDLDWGGKWDITIHLISAYNITSTRSSKLNSLLHSAGASKVVIQDDALPSYYSSKKGGVVRDPQALAREHRYAIQKGLMVHDLFVCFEDDIVITRKHVLNFLSKSSLLSAASTDLPKGTMIIPGFMRVEVVKKGSKVWSAKAINDKKRLSPDFDPSICCSASNSYNSTGVNVMGWEWSPKSFTLINLPAPVNGAVALLPMSHGGPEHGLLTRGGLEIDDPNDDTDRGHSRLFSQQAGVLATRQQILRFDERCSTGYLPPFDKDPNDPSMTGENKGGLGFHNVEFWSGGYHLFGRKCKVERAVFFEDPGDFSRQLLYHRSDNKQDTVSLKRFVWAEEVQEILRKEKIRWIRGGE